LVPSEVPSTKAFCRTAPSERRSLRAICRAGTFFASDFSYGHRSPSTRGVFPSFSCPSRWSLAFSYAVISAARSRYFLKASQDANDRVIAITAPHTNRRAIHQAARNQMICA